MDKRKRVVLFFKHGQSLLLVIARQTFFILFPCLYSLTEELVVENATLLNMRQQDFLLFFGGSQSVFK